MNYNILDILTVCEIDKLLINNTLTELDVVEYYGNEFWRDNSPCNFGECPKCREANYRET